MAAFSSILQQQPFPLDSNSDPSTTINCNNICSPMNEPNNTNYFIPSLHQPHQNLDHNPTDNDDSSSGLLTLTNDKNSTDSSSTVTHHDNYDQVLVTTPMDNKKKSIHLSASNSPNSAQSKDKREVKAKKQKKMKDKIGEGKKKTSSKEEEEKKNAPAGYIHVRARRGEATDSHSLAERVRRERISERMKLLQGLVPGCDKVTGKALMLDQIINYVESLQNQVEFLSTKLASVTPMFCDFEMDLESFMVRPHNQDLSNLASPLESSPAKANDYHQIHLHENSAHSIPFPQPQIPNVLTRQLGSRQALLELDGHRQRSVMNQSGFTNTFFSFH